MAARMTNRRLNLFNLLALLGSLLLGCSVQGADRAARVPVEAPSPEDGWTLLVRSDGPRWLGPSWWREQGVDPEILDTAGIQIAQGDSAAPYAVLGSPDGPGVLFYGETITPDLSLAMTAGQVGAYHLRLGAGGRPVDVAAPPGELPARCQTTTEATVLLGEDAVFRSTAPLTSPWLWVGLRPVDGLTVTVMLTDVVPSTPLTVTMTVWGQSSMPQDPDHHLRLLWNGANIDDHFWDGNAVETWATTVLDAQDVVNALGMIAPGETEAPVELTWLDEAEITWRQQMRASENHWQRWEAESIQSGDAEGACFQLTEAAGDLDLVAVHLGADSAVSFSRAAVEHDVPGTVYVKQSPGDTGWLGVPWLAPSPDLLRPYESLPEDGLLETTYLIVADRHLHRALDPLVEARRQEGVVVSVVSPAAIYDNYGAGTPSPLALQALVADLAGRGSLEALLLVGDAAAHPDAAWNATTVNMPTIWVKTAHVGATASDYAIATGGGEAPLVAVGRFPVTSLEELETIVEKTLAWEPTDRLLLISDDEPAFEHLTKQLGDITAPDQVVDTVRDGARDEVLRWLGDGPGTLVYTGHGSMGLLGDEKLLLLEDGANWRQPTVVVAWSCLCANFAHPTYASLSEAWLLAPEGVVAVVGPTGETTTAEQTALALALQTALSDGQGLGQALLSAWRAARSENAQHGFVLLGDPYLRPMSAPLGEVVPGDQ
jgi:hypothetical protein